jgi:hypothetical protein
LQMPWPMAYTSSRNDLTTQGYPIEGDAVD